MTIKLTISLSIATIFWILGIIEARGFWQRVVAIVVPMYGIFLGVLYAVSLGMSFMR